MPRFVVLEHAGNGIHWDVMLERDNALETWAIDQPLQPGTELPARRLAAHRIAYLDYEGPISRGRGNVRRVAGGIYQLLAWEDSRVLAALRGDQLSGELELRRSGAGASPDDPERWTLRLRGKFA